MTLPLATTTITVKRRAVLATDDPYEVTAAPETVVAGVRAHIGSPAGADTQTGDSARETVEWRLDADVCDLATRDVVVDDTTGLEYETRWAARRVGLGLDHIEAGIVRVDGTV